MPIIHFLRFGIKRLKSQHLLNHYETILFCMERTSCTFDPPENPTMQFTTYMIIICLTPGAPLGACPPGPLMLPLAPLLYMTPTKPTIQQTIWQSQHPNCKSVAIWLLTIWLLAMQPVLLGCCFPFCLGLVMEALWIGPRFRTLAFACC